MSKGEIRSSLGKVSINRPGNKVLTVEDESDNEQVYSRTFNAVNEENDEAYLEELERVRQEKKAAVRRAPEGAKTRLELILGLARLYDDVEIDGIKFTIRSLKGSEVKAVMAALIDSGLTTQILQSFELRAQTLARAICKIDDVDFELVIGSNDINYKAEVIQEMEESVINYLYSKYTALMNQNVKRFDLGKDDKEVVENIKK